MTTRVLYQRLGGMPAIRAVVDDLVSWIPADERVSKWLARRCRSCERGELPHGGATHNKKENLFMTTKIMQWQRIAMLATGIATSMVSMAWCQELYQTHSDGSIWEYTGTPCDKVSCPGWIELDNNPNMNMIAAGGGALYEMHKDGSIWWYTGPVCSGGSCPGWVELDNNPIAVAIGAGGGGIPYEVRSDGSLWEFNGVICTGGFCPGWTELSGPQLLQYPYGFYFGANASLLVSDISSGNSMYALNLFGGAYNSWRQIDTSVESFAVGATTLYDLRTTGAIRQYIPSPTASDWLLIDHNETSYSISAGGGLYQQREDSSIWQYTGTPCNKSGCPGWVKIDNHRYAGALAAGSNTVYQIRGPAGGGRAIMQYTGTPCSGGACSGWAPLDDNPDTTSIVAGPVTFGYHTQ